MNHFKDITEKLPQDNDNFCINFDGEANTFTIAENEDQADKDQIV